MSWEPLSAVFVLIVINTGAKLHKKYLYTCLQNKTLKGNFCILKYPEVLYHHEQCFGRWMLGAQQEYLWILMLLQLNSIHNPIILWARYFPFLHNVQAGSGAHPAPCSVVMGFFHGVKWPGCDVDQSPSSSAEIKSGSSPPCISLYVFISCTGRNLTSLTLFWLKVCVVYQNVYGFFLWLQWSKFCILKPRL